MACLVTVLFVIWKTFHKILLDIYYSSYSSASCSLFDVNKMNYKDVSRKFFSFKNVITLFIYIYILSYTVTATNYKNPNCNYCFYQ